VGTQYSKEKNNRLDYELVDVFLDQDHRKIVNWLTVVVGSNTYYI